MKQRDHLKVVGVEHLPSIEPAQILPEIDARLFCEIVEHYTAMRRGSKRHKPASVEDDLAQVNSMVAFAGKSPWHWTREDFEAWCDHKATASKIAVSTQRKYQGAIRKFMDYLCSNVKHVTEIQRLYGFRPVQICDSDNCIPHVQEREISRERQPLSHEQMVILLEAIDSAIVEAIKFSSKDLRPLQRDKAMFFTIYVGGLRISEATGLNIGSFVPNPHRPEFGNYGSISAWGKGSKGSGPKHRQVPIDHVLLPQLLDWYVTKVRPYFLHNADGNETAMFLSERGKRISVSTAEARFQHVLELAGLDGQGFSPHCLRHSSVTHGIVAGRSLEAMRLKHGHTHAATTQQYCHVPDEFVRDELESSISSHLDLILAASKEKK